MLICHIESSFLERRPSEEVRAMIAAQKAGLLIVKESPARFFSSCGSIGVGGVDFIARNFPVRILSPWAQGIDHGREVWSKADEPLPAGREIFYKPFWWKSHKSELVNADEAPEWAYYASEPAIFVNEYRSYIVDGKVLTTRFYVDLDGKAVDDIAFPWEGKFEGMTCAFDWGISADGRALPIENHPPFAIGWYSDNPDKDFLPYLEFLKAGFAWMQGLPEKRLTIGKPTA